MLHWIYAGYPQARTSPASLILSPAYYPTELCQLNVACTLQFSWTLTAVL